MARIISPDEPNGEGRESPQFRRSVARAAGELSQLIGEYGGAIEGMTFAEEHARREHRIPGEAQWDTGQLPAAVAWAVQFAAAGGVEAGAVALLKSKSRRKIIARLTTLAGLNRMRLTVGGISIDVTGSEASLEKACAQIEKLAANPDIQTLVNKLPKVAANPASSGPRARAVRLLAIPAPAD
jgi:hypothetical protein